MVVSALLAGVGAGAVMVSASQDAGAGSTQGLRVVSTWSGSMWKGAPPVRLESGSLTADPGRGFVLVQTKGQKPGFFTTPEGGGALRLSSRSSYGFVLRSSRGALAVVAPGYPNAGPGPSFTFLGRQLDPANLGPIGANGVAVPFTYGRPQGPHNLPSKTAVVLVEQAKGFPGWKLYGYLPGFSVPRASDRQQELQRPLLGPDGHLYSIDPKQDRLVRGSKGRSQPERLPKFGCTTWPAAGGASYRSCPDSIVLRKASGATSTLFRRHLGKYELGQRAWFFTQASPNGKWLLLEDDYGACGIATWADFLPSSGGRLISAFPGAYTSQALGWLPDNTALVAAQSEGCEGAASAGIYQVWPGNTSLGPPPRLVFPAAVQDATTWGFGARPAG
jgi:hypothetical protein